MGHIGEAEHDQGVPSKTGRYPMTQKPTPGIIASLPDVIGSVPNPYYNNDKNNDSTNPEIVKVVKNVYYE